MAHFLTLNFRALTRAGHVALGTMSLTRCGRGPVGSLSDVGTCRGVPPRQSETIKDAQVHAIIDVSMYGDNAIVTPMLVHTVSPGGHNGA